MTYLLSENSGNPLEYSTETQPGSGELIRVQVTSAWMDADRAGVELPNEDGYEWIGISSVIRSDQPCCWVLSYEDYYTLEQYDDREVECGAGDGFNYKKASFSITYNGKKHDECRMLLIIPHPGSAPEGGTVETTINVFYRVPKGYDGCVLGFHNSSALTQKQVEMGLSDPAASLGLIERTKGDLYIRLK